MAHRFVYLPSNLENSLVEKKNITFEWFSGFSKSQKQKTINSFHEAIFQETGISKILEISSSSKQKLGIKMSAFNLKTSFGQKKASVECFYQASKVFEYGGPFLDLIDKSSLDAKTDSRLRENGRLKYFLFEGEKWGLNEGFYDWLYLNALLENEQIGKQLLEYEGFTDIAFNPKKSFNCQAYSTALFISLVNKKVKLEILYPQSIHAYRELMRKYTHSDDSLI